MTEPKYKVGDRIGFYTINMQESNRAGVIIDIAKKIDGKSVYIIQSDKIIAEISEFYPLDEILISEQQYKDQYYKMVLNRNKILTPKKGESTYE